MGTLQDCGRVSFSRRCHCQASLARCWCGFWIKSVRSVGQSFWGPDNVLLDLVMLKGTWKVCLFLGHHAGTFPSPPLSGTLQYHRSRRCRGEFCRQASPRLLGVRLGLGLAAVPERKFGRKCSPRLLVTTRARLSQEGAYIKLL